MKNIQIQKDKYSEAFNISQAFDSIFNIISDYIVVVDVNFSVVDINQKYCKYLKQDKQSIKGFKCFKIFEKYHNLNHRCPCMKVLETKKPEYVYCNINNRDFKLISHPIFDKNNTIKFLVVVLQDITDIKNSIELSFENENKFKVLFDYSLDGIALLKNNDIAEINKSFSNLFDKNTDELLGQNFVNLVDDSDKGKTEEVFNTVLSDKRHNSHFMELKLHSRNDNNKYIDCAVKSIIVENKRMILLSCRDTTRRKMAEMELIATKEKSEKNEKIVSKFNRLLSHLNEQLETKVQERTQDLTAAKQLLEQQNIELLTMKTNAEKDAERLENLNRKLMESEKSLRIANESKDKFFSIIAHDIKNPLQAIISSSYLLNSYYQNQKFTSLEKHICRITDASTTINNLLESLLTWARSQCNKINFKPENIGVDGIWREIENELFHVAENKEITLRFNDVGESLVYADKNMLLFVLRNLITNSIKFTHPGGKITINYSSQDDNYSFFVKDTGVGMTKVEQDGLFNIENKVSKQGTSQEHGTGLGLSICNEFIGKHSGKIWVDSEIGLGTTIYFDLPKKQLQQSTFCIHQKQHGMQLNKIIQYAG